ncbi:MAG: NAD-dependent epimerase/dehydratase family protein [Alphaproteobacteria bacterium]|nr:NAD-dependent epimerase/dehydratase family protein [Alphaproteobacteria bacterium]
MRVFVPLLFALLSAVAPSAMAASVMVFGASGQLGAEIVRALTAGGHDVTAFVRPSSDLARLKDYNVKLVKGDVLNEADVRSALAPGKFDVVVDALARGKADPSFYDVSQRLISAAAKDSGVKHIILHSSVGAGDSKAIYPKNRWEAMKATLLAKEAGENHVMASGVTYTIIRNAVLRNLEPGASERTGMFEDQSVFGGVTRTGLARATNDCISAEVCKNKIYHAIDPEVKIPDAAR